MTTLAIAGITHLSDLYPNVKYKIRLLSTIQGIDTATVLYDLGAGSFYKSATGNPVTRMLGLVRNCWAHCVVFARLVIRRPTHVYICYPGIFLANMFLLWPARYRPVIVLDAFISLYDTAINDRRMVDAASWRARLLYRLERRAFSLADHVITDTEENAAFYSELFDLPRSKFVEIPLCIPPFPESGESNRPLDFTCLFVGSLVPLQGIGAILDAAARLREVPGIRFRIIGDGQEAALVESFLQDTPLPNLHWDRGFFPTSRIVDEIRSASVCLGIFGKTDKANRVFPYKLYYYCRAGKPFVTGRTPCVERLSRDCPGDFALVDMSDNDALTATIRTLHANADLLHTLGKASENLFQQRFSEATIAQHLSNLFVHSSPRH